MKVCRTILAVVAISATTLDCGSAGAAGLWPDSVLGVWVGLNNLGAIKLDITTQDTTTACNGIDGTLTTRVGTADTIAGFYCPYSGRISFLRQTGADARTIRAYAGNLSINTGTVWMSGRFAQVVRDAGAPKGENVEIGEYGFSLRR